MPYTIIRDNIVSLHTDAIVNAANCRLAAGGGVCGAIFQAAGAKELQAACNKIGYCKTGDAVMTPGFHLPAKYIIHTVGPIYGNDPEKEERELYSCYARSLSLARENGIQSIAFPVISSGIYGYPKEEAIKVARRAIRDFLADHEMDIYLVVYDKETFGISEKLFTNVKSYIDERMVLPDMRRESLNLAYPAAPMPEAAKYSASESEGLPCFGTSLEEAEDLDALLQQKVETFSEMLLRMIDEKGMTDVEVYKRANIDRKLFSKIRKKDYIPRKATVMALIVALRLNFEEASSLLAQAGYAFSKASKFDLIIEYFIERQIYDIFDINDTLFAFDQPLLGA